MNDKAIPDALMKKAMNVLFNVWFEKWKRKVGHFSQDDWDVCVAELTRIAAQGDYALVREVGTALISELERRDKDKGEH